MRDCRSHTHTHTHSLDYLKMLKVQPGNVYLIQKSNPQTIFKILATPPPFHPLENRETLSQRDPPHSHTNTGTSLQPNSQTDGRRL